MAKIEDFYNKYFNSGKDVIKLNLEELQELKREGVTAEQFLDYICQEKRLLLHGSIHQAQDDKLTSKNNNIFATNKSAIAIMRSLYSNKGVNLEYPYFIDSKNPLVIKIHTPANGKFVKKDEGFIYVLNRNGFRNKPKGSWQFIKEVSKVDFIAVIETESEDFTYQIKIFNDYDPKI